MGSCWQEIQGLRELRETGNCTTRIIILAGQLGRDTTSSPYFGHIILGVGALSFSISCLVMVLFTIGSGAPELLPDEKNNSSSYLMIMKRISSSI